MPKGTRLTEFEQGLIIAYNDQKMSMRQIADKISRSKTVVSNFLKNPSEYCLKKPTGRNLYLASEQSRQLFAKPVIKQLQQIN